MVRMSVAEARQDFKAVLDRAAYSRERTVITRNDTDVAAVISIEELRLLDALIERWEDEEDIKAAEEALLEAREERVAWSDLKEELGL
jgi:prevent-host-death family protein